MVSVNIYNTIGENSFAASGEEPKSENTSGHAPGITHSCSIPFEEPAKGYEHLSSLYEKNDLRS
uniref:Uncharacterized protein n=1 Tax=Thermosporothrix sp. COM3 TaxID=2490863 RepID=A0A455SIM3_9CHLR|nr:hypothetical protein KTC_21610 [Thermosporothrix sp. COM3]